MNYINLQYKLRRLYMIIRKIDCDDCIHYGRGFGDEECFHCERSVTADGYERRRYKKVS